MKVVRRLRYKQDGVGWVHDRFTQIWVLELTTGDFIQVTHSECDYSSPRLENLGLEFNGGFVQAFLYPPFSMKLSGTIKEVGEYVIDFMNLFFDNLKEIEIFT